MGAGPTFRDDDDRIEWYFQTPQVPPSQHSRDGALSTPYLLRRELVETIGYDPNVSPESDVDANGSKSRLFASVILMFTVIDLLAKYVPNPAGRVGDRFKNFLESQHGGQLSPYDASLLWAVRDSLVHAFGLPDSTSLADAGIQAVAIGQRKVSQMGGMRGLVSIERQGDTAILYVDGLFRVVREATQRFRESLYGADSREARAAFLAVFPNYGWIFM